MRTGTELESGGEKRICSLDGLRGAACLVVLVYHFFLMLGVWGADAPYALVPGAPAVLVFFVLSGVVLSLCPLARLRGNESYDWLGYFPRRVVRLGVPLACAVALGIVAGYVAWRMGSGSRSALAIDFGGGPDAVVHDVLMQFDVLFNVSDDVVTLAGEPLRRVNSPVWSMCWEMWFSLTLPLAIALLGRLRHDAWAVLAAFAGIFVSYWCGYFPLRLCLMFWIGVIIAKHLGSLSERRVPPVASLAALLALVGVIELGQAASVGLLGGLDSLALAALLTLMSAACAGLVVIAVVEGPVRRALSARPAQVLGTLSFSLYLTHAMVMGGLAVLLPRMGVTSAVAQALVVSVACLVVGALFWRLVEAPAMGLSRRVGRSLGDGGQSTFATSRNAS